MSHFKDNQLMAGEIALGILVVIGVILVIGVVLTFLASIPFDHR